MRLLISIVIVIMEGFCIYIFINKKNSGEGSKEHRGHVLVDLALHRSSFMGCNKIISFCLKVIIASF